jgi:kinesin family member 22
MVDLAGYESNKRTGNLPNSERMKESTGINMSLSALRRVVEALNRGGTRIPYRASKLTRILSVEVFFSTLHRSGVPSYTNSPTDVLGGNAAGVLVCNIAPTSAQYLDSVSSTSLPQPTLAKAPSQTKTDRVS